MNLVLAVVFLTAALFMLRCLEVGMSMSVEEFNARTKRKHQATAAEYDHMRYYTIPALIRTTLFWAVFNALLYYFFQR